MWLTLSLVVLVSFANAQTSDSIIIQLEQGPVRGRIDQNGGVYNFNNIPYATAPTGVNKFKAPLPPPTWTDPYDESDKAIICIQFQREYGRMGIPENMDMKEDCLIANVAIPETRGVNLPVLVVVHGGGFQFGFGRGQAGNFNTLVRSQKIIVVSFNYRLGVPGFLCLRTENVPGNAGMKDQVALLRWVKKNIASFGGNPNDVTIQGCSAGGGSVDYLTISPLTAGLFSKAIPESGTFFGSVGPQRDPLNNAKEYARKLNFTNVDNLVALEEFYATASHNLLISETESIMDRPDTLQFFAPCIERNIGEEAFLKDSPDNILKNKEYHKVPILSGFSEMEGMVQMYSFNNFKIKMNENFADFLPAELHFKDDNEKRQVASKVKEFYFGDKIVSEETVLEYVDFFTDVMFAYPMFRTKTLRRGAMGDTIYLYEYSFTDENTPFVPYTTIRGANHCFQTIAVADDEPSSTITHTEEYLSLREKIRNYWINFITTGNPTPPDSPLLSWPAVNGINTPFMSLNTTSAVIQSSLLGERIQFWDTLYEEYYSSPLLSSANSASTTTVSFIIILACTFILNIII